MGLTLKPMCNDGLEMFPIPVFPQNSLISTLPLGNGLAAALGTARACLMQGHGVVTVAPTPEEAVLTMILVEEQAKMNVLARQSLGPNYSGIPQDQVEAYAAQPDGKSNVPGIYERRQPGRVRLSGREVAATVVFNICGSWFDSFIDRA
jgi:ribulose-5-phosphate 4-epimerase/fuculose-1-phosphate aldolase